VINNNFKDLKRNLIIWTEKCCKKDLDFNIWWFKRRCKI